MLAITRTKLPTSALTKLVNGNHQQLLFYRGVPTLDQVGKKEKVDAQKKAKKGQQQQQQQQPQKKATAKEPKQEKKPAPTPAQEKKAVAKQEFLSNKEKKENVESLQKLAKKLLPKRSPTPYALFLSDRFSQHHKPGQTAASVLPDLARQWRATNAAGRKPYEERSKKAHAEYEQVQANYLKLFKPKRPANPRALLMKEKYQELEGSFTDRAKQLTSLWEALPAAEKAKREADYKTQAEAYRKAREADALKSPEKLAKQWADWLTAQKFTFYPALPAPKKPGSTKSD